MPAPLIAAGLGIDINDAAENKLTQDQRAKLKEFEFQYQANQNE